ncbi:hypothetical protein CJ030_MR3G009520 [Morella rubra]|uniref:RNase H type-1 domain-containing protein n=1 Tax=Morella rubra TaxID=262757 RepID=A0A6A1W864_9ROSI|nr:hypothetical protein CJ030_MR3G009520 [Morella rubra]
MLVCYWKRFGRIDCGVGADRAEELVIVLESLTRDPNKAPPCDVVKINVDVSIRDNFAVTTAILRDHNGNVLSWKVYKIPKTSPLEGEALAAKKGFEEACRKGLSSIMLQGDSLNVIQAIKAYPTRVE